MYWQTGKLSKQNSLFLLFDVCTFFSILILRLLLSCNLFQIYLFPNRQNVFSILEHHIYIISPLLFHVVYMIQTRAPCRDDSFPAGFFLQYTHIFSEKISCKCHEERCFIMPMPIYWYAYYIYFLYAHQYQDVSQDLFQMVSCQCHMKRLFDNANAIMNNAKCQLLNSLMYFIPNNIVIL